MGYYEECTGVDFVDSEDIESGMGILGFRALDNNVNEEDFCMILGYLAYLREGH